MRTSVISMLFFIFKKKKMLNLSKKITRWLDDMKKKGIGIKKKCKKNLREHLTAEVRSNFKLFFKKYRSLKFRRKINIKKYYKFRSRLIKTALSVKKKILLLFFYRLYGFRNYKVNSRYKFYYKLTD